MFWSSETSWPKNTRSSNGNFPTSGRYNYQFRAKGTLLELRDYLSVLWRRRWIIVLSVAVGCGSAIGLSAQMTPTYEAKTKVFIGPRSVEEGDAVGTIEEMPSSPQLVASYAEVLKSRPLADKVVQKMAKGPWTGASLAEKVQTRIIPETRLIEVTVSAETAEQAQSFANEIANTFVQDVGRRSAEPGDQSVSIFEAASRPASPVSPKTAQNAVTGALLGAMVGIGVAFLLDRLDTTVVSKEDLERAAAPLPVIGQIPLAGRKMSSIAFRDDPDSPQAEAFRILRTNVHFFSVDRPVETVLVTSPYAGEGKTTVAMNLAAGMAAVGSKVLLVETDLRKPVLYDAMELDGLLLGLSNVLAGQIELDEAIQQTSVRNLHVLAAGSIPPNPSELLASEQMMKVIKESKGLADVVIFDATPTLPVTDAAVLAPHMDAVLLVARAGRTPAGKLADVVGNLQRHDVRILGVVLNGLEGSQTSGYYSYRHYRAAATGRGGFLRKKRQQEDGNEFRLAPERPAVRPAPRPSVNADEFSSNEK